MIRVVLPAHLEWEASIPNPGDRTVEITNAQGLACWDSSKGSSGCGGPQAAIAIRTERGRTYFSVCDQTGIYSDNEGFFEFEARVK